MVDPNQAWNDALKLRSYELDQAVSQSQVLYFISTTNGFKGGKEVTANSVKDLNDATSSENSSSQTNDSASSEFCMDHPKCNEAQLTGECCPTSNGIFLGCCDSIEEQQERTSSTKETTPGGELSAALSNNNNDDRTDYHYYRLDKNGFWSHKPGRSKVTNRDAKNESLHIKPLIITVG